MVAHAGGQARAIQTRELQPREAVREWACGRNRWCWPRSRCSPSCPPSRGCSRSPACGGARSPGPTARAPPRSPWPCWPSAPPTGSWVAAIGLRGLGLAAAGELGVVLSQLLLVDVPPGPQWATAVAAALDGVDAVLLEVPPPCGGREADARRLQSRLRDRGAVVVLVGAAGPFQPDLVVAGSAPVWHGLGCGWGHLRARCLPVEVSGRRAASRSRTARLWLPDPEGAVRLEESPAARAPGDRGAGGRRPPPPAGHEPRGGQLMRPPRSGPPPRAAPRLDGPGPRPARRRPLPGLAGGRGRSGGDGPDAPMAVMAANRVVAASLAAREEGVGPGLRRREAQARCPPLTLVPTDPAQEARAFEDVLRAIERFTPLVELTEPGTATFGARGPSRYHGGDEAFAALVAEAVTSSPRRPGAGHRTSGGGGGGRPVRRHPGRSHRRGPGPAGRAGMAGGARRWRGGLPRPVPGRWRWPTWGWWTGTWPACSTASACGPWPSWRPCPPPTSWAASARTGERCPPGRGRPRRPSPGTRAPPPELTVHLPFEPAVLQSGPVVFAAKHLADDLQAEVAARGAW